MIRLFTKAGTTKLSALRSLEHIRFVSQTHRVFEKSEPAKQSSTPAESQSTDASQAPTDASQPWQKKSSQRTVTNFDKRVLVSTGKYKTIEEVPDKVAHETLDRARDRYRVKMCIYMMIVCTVICIIQVIRGKKAVERGESVVNSNLEWHRQYNEASAAKEGKK